MGMRRAAGAVARGRGGQRSCAWVCLGYVDACEGAVRMRIVLCAVLRARWGMRVVLPAVPRTKGKRGSGHAHNSACRLRAV